MGGLFLWGWVDGLMSLMCDGFNGVDEVDGWMILIKWRLMIVLILLVIDVGTWDEVLRGGDGYRRTWLDGFFSGF